MTGQGHQPCTPPLDKAKYNELTKLVKTVGVEVKLGFLMARSRENHVCYLGVQEKKMVCRELFWSGRECKLCCGTVICGDLCQLGEVPVIAHHLI